MAVHLKYFLRGRDALDSLVRQEQEMVLERYYRRTEARRKTLDHSKTTKKRGLEQEETLTHRKLDLKMPPSVQMSLRA